MPQEGAHVSIDGMSVAVGILVVDALLCVGAFLAGGDDPHLHFREFGFVTWLDAIQLFGIAALGGAIYAQRAPAAGARLWLWLLAAMLFLGFDEIFSLSQTNGVLLTFARETLGLPIREEYAIANLGSVRAGDLLQASYAGTVLLVFAYYRQELLRVPAAVGLFALGVVLLAGALYIDAGPSHDQFLLPGTASLGSALEPLQDSLKLLGFGAILGGFVVIYGNATATSA